MSENHKQPTRFEWSRGRLNENEFSRLIEKHADKNIGFVEEPSIISTLDEAYRVALTLQTTSTTLLQADIKKNQRFHDRLAELFSPVSGNVAASFLVESDGIGIPKLLICRNDVVDTIKDRQLKIAIGSAVKNVALSPSRRIPRCYDIY